MFKLAIKVCFENYFGLIHALLLLLGSTKSVYFFGTPSSSVSCVLMPHLGQMHFRGHSFQGKQELN